MKLKYPVFIIGFLFMLSTLLASVHHLNAQSCGTNPNNLCNALRRSDIYTGKIRAARGFIGSSQSSLALAPAEAFSYHRLAILNENTSRFIEFGWIHRRVPNTSNTQYRQHLVWGNAGNQASAVRRDYFYFNMSRVYRIQYVNNATTVDAWEVYLDGILIDVISNSSVNMTRGDMMIAGGEVRWGSESLTDGNIYGTVLSSLAFRIAGTPGWLNMDNHIIYSVSGWPDYYNSRYSPFGQKNALLNCSRPGTGHVPGCQPTLVWVP